MKSINVILSTITLAAALLCAGAASAAPSITIGSGSALPGSEVDIAVSFSPGGDSVASLQFDLALGSQISFVSATAGSVLTSAQKTITSSDVPAGRRFLIFGFNSNEIGAGSLLTVRLRIESGATPGPRQLSPSGIVFSSPAAQSVSGSGTGGTLTVQGTTPTTLTVSGVITSNGAGLSGVQVFGGSLGTQVTNGAGAYSFSNIPSGTNVTLTPSLSGYTFSPSSFSETVTSSRTVNFTASQSTPTNYSISGLITANGQPLNGVTVNGGALGSRVTNSAGAYSFTGLTQGTSYTLTPSLSGYTFSPPSASGSVTGNIQVNFSAVTQQVNRFDIGGTVTKNGAALAGVSVRLQPFSDSRITDSLGRYSFTQVLQGTSYTLVPTLAGHTFTPASVSGTLNGNTTVNFTASQSTPTSYSVSGLITLNGVGLSGVTVNGGALGTQTTNAAGAFSFTNLAQGTSFSLSPSLTGYTFAPATALGTVTGNMQVNFAAAQITASTVQLSGTVMLNGVGLAGVTVNGGILGSPTTNSAGQFLFPQVPRNASFTLTPSLSGYTFSPQSYSGVASSNLAVAFAAQQQNPCPTGNCGGNGLYSVSGTVLLGTTPVAGVTLKIGRRAATSDAQGRYTIGGLTPGRYRISASRSGIRLKAKNGTRLSISTSDLSGVDFDAACRRRTYDFVNGECSLVTYSLSGRILLEGTGLEGVRVRAGRGIAYTDAAGNYRLDGLPKGRYYVSALLRGHRLDAASGNRRIEFLGDTSNFDFVASCYRGYTVVNGRCTR